MHPVWRLVFWWAVGGILLTGAAQRLPCDGRRLGGLVALACGLYVALLHAPSLGLEQVRVERDRLEVLTGPWTDPIAIQLPLADVVRVYEQPNPFPLVADRYLIFETATFKRRRMRQTALLRWHRDAVLENLGARGIEVVRR